MTILKQVVVTQVTDKIINIDKSEAEKGEDKKVGFGDGDWLIVFVLFVVTTNKK